jgi:Fic family protein
MSFQDKLQEIERLQQVIQEHGRLSDDVLNKINYKFRLEWNYTSNSMEGNSLTRKETRSVMVGNITVEGKPIKDVLEMKGHDEVVKDILKMGKGELNISESRIRNLHKAIVHDEDPEKQNQIGVWKREPNYLFNYKNERFDFVAPEEVPGQMHRLMNWLNAQKEKLSRKDKDSLHPVMLAFQFHLRYITIHPFCDGNGRTARILTNIILITFGYPPVYIKESEKKVYYQYLADIQGYGGGPDLFYEFMAGTLIRSQQLVLAAIEGKEIEEPDDWEKRLALLKKQLADRKEVKSKSVEAVLDIINNSVFPLMERLMAKLSEFDDLFAEKKMLFGGISSQRLIQSIEQAKLRLQERKDEHMSGVTFSYELNGFKKAGTNTFYASIELNWKFEDFNYLFFLDHNDDSKAIVKLYDQNFSAHEVESFVSECGSRMLQKIEERISQHGL